MQKRKNMTKISPAAESARNKQRIISASAVAIFVLLSAVICFFVGLPMIRFASDPDKFRALVDAHGVMGRLAYIGMVVLQITVAIIPGEPMEIAAGYAFGAVEGTVICMLASGLGSMLVVWLVRRYGTRLVEVFFSEEKLKSLCFLKSSPKRTMIFMIFFMLPGTPKDLLCYFAGLTDIKLSTLLLICSLGRIPSIVTSTVGGDALGTKSYVFAAAVFAVTIGISAAGLLIYNRICKKHEKQSEENARTENGGKQCA